MQVDYFFFKFLFKTYFCIVYGLGIYEIQSLQSEPCCSIHYTRCEALSIILRVNLTQSRGSQQLRGSLLQYLQRSIESMSTV